MKIYLRVLLDIFKAIPGYTILLFIISIFEAILVPMELNILNKMVDSLSKIQNSDFEKILSCAFLFIAIHILKIVIGVIRSSLKTISSNKIKYTFYGKLFSVLSEINLTYFDQSKFNLKIKRSKKAIENILFEALESFLGIFSAIISLVGIVVLIIKIDKIYFLIFLIVSIVQNIYSFKITQENIILDKEQDDIERRHYYLFRLLYDHESIREIRDYKLYDWIEEKRTAEFEKIFKKSINFTKKWLKINSIWSLLMAIIELSFLLCMVVQMHILKLTIAQFITVYQSYEMFITNASSVVNSFNTLSRYGVILSELFEVIDMKSKQYKREFIKYNNEEKFILNNINFSYDKNMDVLKKISLVIEKGETVAFVGHNGSGKSTLAKILLHMIEPDKGIIEFPLFVAHKSSAVFQDFSRFNFSVFENVILGNVETIEKEQLQTVIDKVNIALSKSQCKEFVDRLPQGIDTELGTEYNARGVDISIGQWQRLAIARSVYRDSEFIVYDEPTASLDPVAEKKEFDYIKQALRGKTVVLVSHRIGFNKMADKIVFLEEGEIAECGTHDELMKRRDKYYRFYNAQAQWYKEDMKI